jgi:hypothetical protein
LFAPAQKTGRASKTPGSILGRHNLYKWVSFRSASTYLDHWIDENTFHWQSQNATTPESSKGRSIIDHQKTGWQIHLFLRDNKLSNGTAAPFTYHGTANYVKHEGSAPMSVTLALQGAPL